MLQLDTSPYIDIDFGQQTATGSPLIFGGAHAPNLEHQDAWDKITDVGVTMIRRDFFLENEVPAKIALSDYKKNVNDVQNPDTWDKTANWTNITITNQIYENAKSSGMKVMGILSYAPAWLTYSGTTKGVPKDWDIYEDIVKKVYKLHRDKLDFLEIWNEPDYKTFLDLKNTPYSKEEAYALIYFHAQKAIKEVDKEINDGKVVPIGGMVVSNPTDTIFFEGVLSRIVTNSQIDFVTYHNYEQIAEPSWTGYKNILSKYGKADLPIYLTEWNHNYRSDQTDPYHYTDLAIPYTGGKLLSFLNMGLAGANYFNLQMFNFAKPNTYEGSFGFYRMINGKAELLPQAKTWRILSKSLALGNGPSKIFSVVSSQNSVAFENVFKQKGLAVVNDGDKEQITNITISNIQLKKSLFTRTVAEVYVANKNFDGGRMIEKIPVEAKEGKIQFALKMPGQTIIGIIFQEENMLKEIFNTQ